MGVIATEAPHALPFGKNNWPSPSMEGQKRILGWGMGSL
ncbi:hypothetical protein CYA_0063 [Synechococcus sp. JA-3-3Ab]|nr:hypothetical protein CYA_0063 [Synechococcus sp. JA-3-3Ab]